MNSNLALVWNSLLQNFPYLLQMGGAFLAVQMVPAAIIAITMGQMKAARAFAGLAIFGMVVCSSSLSVIGFCIEARLPTPFYFCIVLIGFVLGVVLTVLSPFSAAITAFALKSPRRTLILTLNVFLLFTIIGPIALFYLVLKAPAEAKLTAGGDNAIGDKPAETLLADGSASNLSDGAATVSEPDGAATVSEPDGSGTVSESPDIVSPPEPKVSEPENSERWARPSEEEPVAKLAEAEPKAETAEAESGVEPKPDPSNPAKPEVADSDVH